jgi:hypothetical protein
MVHPKLFGNIFFALLVSLSIISCAFTEEAGSESASEDESAFEALLKETQTAESELAGEFFGVPVPKGNYYFARAVVASFGAPWRGTPKTMEELNDLTWQELILSYEAFRRGIEVSDDELSEEIGKTLKADKVDFDWKKDKEAYEAWVKEKLRESVEAFENQMRHLVQLRKLREEVIDSIEPEVSEEEAYRKFLDEYNSLSVELVEFEDLEEATRFYEKAKEPVGPQAVDELIWEDCLLSHQAHQRNITLGEDEIKAAITRFLRERGVNFRWDMDEERFAKWVDENIGSSIEDFKKRVADLAEIDKLRQMIAANQEDPLSQEYKEFLDKNKKISRAYKNVAKKYGISRENVLYFGNIKAARGFYEKMQRKPGFWEDKKREDPKSFRRPGFVALDFLINIWGFARDDAYAMLDKEPETFYEPSPIYKGYGVFKVLRARKAQKEKFQERRQYYFDRVAMIKKYEGFKDWLKALKEEADIKDYMKE